MPIMALVTAATDDQMYHGMPLSGATWGEWAVASKYDYKSAAPCILAITASVNSVVEALPPTSPVRCSPAA
jgi:hypothetical protein